MTAQALTVSVIVCARPGRRWSDLRASVESARAQSEATEVIVVVDHDPALLHQAQGLWPNLLVVDTSVGRGLEAARNTGVDWATGEIVAFLGDDVVADADWLTWMLDSFADVNVAGVGGHAEPEWPGAHGSALYCDELLWLVGCSYRGLPAEQADVRAVIDRTMAFRRAAVLAAGGFRAVVSRVGNASVDGGATELGIRIRQIDPAARISYEPLSLVTHSVPAERDTWHFLIRRSFAQGVSKAALSRSVGRGDALSGDASYLAWALPKALLRQLGLVGRGGAKRALAIVVSMTLNLVGYAVGAVTGARSAEPSAAAAAVVPGPPLQPTTRV